MRLRRRAAAWVLAAAAALLGLVAGASAGAAPTRAELLGRLPEDCVVLAVAEGEPLTPEFWRENPVTAPFFGPELQAFFAPLRRRLEDADDLAIPEVSMVALGVHFGDLGPTVVGVAVCPPGLLESLAGRGGPLVEADVPSARTPFYRLRQGEDEDSPHLVEDGGFVLMAEHWWTLKELMASDSAHAQILANDLPDTNVAFVANLGELIRRGMERESRLGESAEEFVEGEAADGMREFFSARREAAERGLRLAENLGLDAPALLRGGLRPGEDSLEVEAELLFDGPPGPFWELFLAGAGAPPAAGEVPGGAVVSGVTSLDLSEFWRRGDALWQELHPESRREFDVRVLQPWKYATGTDFQADLLENFAPGWVEYVLPADEGRFDAVVEFRVRDGARLRALVEAALRMVPFPLRPIIARREVGAALVVELSEARPDPENPGRLSAPGPRVMSLALADDRLTMVAGTLAFEELPAARDGGFWAARPWPERLRGADNGFTDFGGARLEGWLPIVFRTLLDAQARQLEEFDQHARWLRERQAEGEEWAHPPDPEERPEWLDPAAWPDRWPWTGELFWTVFRTPQSLRAHYLLHREPD